MKNLELVKSFNFSGVKCDIYSKDNEVFMTINQLAGVLGYKDRKGIEKIIERNEYLRDKEFSTTDKLSATDGKYYNTRIFTEDGIYEVTMLSKTEVGKKFRKVVRGIIKSLRKGENKIIQEQEWQVY